MFKGVLWDLFEKLSNQGISFVISVFLARLLSPEEFGLIGMVFVIVGMSQVFLDMGLSAAIIQRQDLTQKHYSSVFFLNIFVGILLSLIVFFSAGLIADFYNQPALYDICRVLSIMFILNSLVIIQNAQFRKNMDFKKPAIIRVVATFIGGIVGIFMAFQEFGVWSLVAQSLLSGLVFTLGLWLLSDWRPVRQFDLAAIKDLWGFSSKLFVSGILDAIFTRLDIIIIGKIFSASALGFYTRAQTMNNMVVQYSSGSLAKVFFPAISKMQHDIEQVKALFLKAITLVSFLVFGFLGFLFLCSEDIFVLLFTEKWLPSVKYFQILVLAGYVYPLSSIMVNVISGRGNSTAFLKLEVLKKILLGLGLIIGFTNGILGFLYCLVIVYFLSIVLNIYYVSKEINITMLLQFRTIFTYFIIAFISVGLLWIADTFFIQDRFWHLLMVGSLFTTFYLLINLIARTNAILFLITQFNRRLKQSVV